MHSFLVGKALSWPICAGSLVVLRRLLTLLLVDSPSFHHAKAVPRQACCTTTGAASRSGKLLGHLLTWAVFVSRLFLRVQHNILFGLPSGGPSKVLLPRRFQLFLCFGVGAIWAYMEEEGYRT